MCVTDFRWTLRLMESPLTCTWNWATMERLFLWRKMKTWRWHNCDLMAVLFFTYFHNTFFRSLTWQWIWSLIILNFHIFSPTSVPGPSPPVHLPDSSGGAWGDRGDHWGILGLWGRQPQEEAPSQTSSLRHSPTGGGQLLLRWEREGEGMGQRQRSDGTGESRQGAGTLSATCQVRGVKQLSGSDTKCQFTLYCCWNRIIAGVVVWCARCILLFEMIYTYARVSTSTTWTLNTLLCNVSSWFQRS